MTQMASDSHTSHDPLDQVSLKDISQCAIQDTLTYISKSNSILFNFQNHIIREAFTQYQIFIKVQYLSVFRPNYKLRNKCIVYIQIVAGINWGSDDENAVLLGDA